MGERLNNSCLVCCAQSQGKAAQQLMTTTTTSDPGSIVKLEEIGHGHPEHEFIIAEDDDYIPNHNNHFLLEDSKVEEKEHLKPLFILKRIFKLPEESIGDLLVQLEYATNGVQLCSHCDERAHQFHQTLQQMSDLQRILDEIEKEFKDKIERSKNVSSTFRERIRRCVVMTDSFSGSHSEPDVDENDEYNQNQNPDSLNIDIEESMIIKTEVVELDLHTFDGPLTSDGYTSPSTLLDSSTYDNDDDDEVDETRENLPSTKKRKKQEAKVLASKKKVKLVVNEPRPAPKIIRKNGVKFLQCPNCPYATSTPKDMNIHLTLHEKNGGGVPCPDCARFVPQKSLPRHRACRHPPSKTNRKKSSFGQSPILYKCPHCTHKTTNIATSQYHKGCHEEGSRATACNQCNVFVLPGSRCQLNHRIYCVPIIQSSLATEENQKLENKGEKRSISHSHPYYITFKRGKYATRHYQCLQCPYETLYNNRILAHVEFHEEGSLAVPCGECGWFLLPQHLDTHRQINHTIVVEEVPIIPGPSSAALGPKFKCSECSYECQIRGVLDYHFTGHNRQVAESKCKACGCYLSLRLSRTHKAYCFARATQEAAEKTEDTSESEGESLMELVE